MIGGMCEEVTPKMKRMITNDKHNIFVIEVEVGAEAEIAPEEEERVIQTKSPRRRKKRPKSSTNQISD